MEKPILFSGSMVRAILDGSKTQTRRLIKPQPKAHVRDLGRIGSNGNQYAPPDPQDEDSPDFRYAVRCPYGVPGGRLWVRESFQIIQPGQDPIAVYRATCADDGSFNYVDPADGTIARLKIHQWIPSIHMPRFASRLTLEIVDIWAHRLQDIDEGDIIAEGCPSDYLLGRNWFQPLWDEINGKKAPWESNPWVWAITFKRVTEGS